MLPFGMAEHRGCRRKNEWGISPFRSSGWSRRCLEVIYTPCDLDKISVEIAEVNRPGLFLAGYYDYFDKLRLQIMGLAEMNFLAGLTAEKRRERLDQLFRQQPPAVILCRNEEL